MKISEIIIHYLVICVLTIILIKAYEKYATKKLKFNKKTILKMLVMSIVYLLNNLFVFNIIRVLTSTIIAFFFFKWFYKEKTGKTIYYTLVLTIILHIIDLSCSLFLPLWIKNVELLNQSLFFKIGFSIIVNLIFYFVVTNKIIVNFFKKIEQIRLNNKLFYFLGTIGLLTCNIWLFFVSEDTANKTLNIILGITEIIILLSIIIVLKNKYEKDILIIKEEQLKQNLDLYTKVAKEYKELKHNLMNDFLIIKTKLPNKEQDFMNDIITKYKSNYEWVNDVTDIPEGLQGLVFLKKNQAELKKIKFNLEYNVDKDIEDTFDINNNFKLYETLGILFDNAIEGAELSKEKIINVVFSYNKKTLQISILNTFNNDIDLEKLGSENYSTKNRGSGIGLNYIKRQKNRFKINQSIHDNIFITDITIEHKEKK